MVNNRLYDDAIAVYLKGRKILSKENLFVFELANIYVLRLKLEEATLEYLKYMESNTNQFNYIESRIINYTKEPEQAKQVAEILLKQQSQSQQKYLVVKLLADLYLRIEEYSLAFEQFKLLENLEPPNQRLKNTNGKELFFFSDKAFKAGQYQYAEQAYEVILEKYSKSIYKARSLYGLAIIKQNQGQLNDALIRLEELVELQPSSTLAQDALFQTGEIYLEDIFDLDKALQAYNKVIENYPNGKNTYRAYFRIGDCYVAKGNYKTAKTWFERSKNLLNVKSPLRNQAIYKTGHIQFLNKEYDKSLETLKEIIDQMGKNDVDQSYVNDALELSFLIEENKAKAVAALQLYSDACKYNLQKKPDKAIASLIEITENYPDVGLVEIALMDLGALEKSQQNYIAAINYFEILLNEHPESIYNALAQKRIAEIYESGIGDAQKAFEAFESVLINYPESLYIEEVRQKLRELQTQRLNN
jgi:tetratricopeptide (TPR) repeat protein